VAHVLLSHGHRDHSGAARMLQARTGAPILAAMPNRPASEASAPTPPDVVLTDGAVVAAGGLQLQAIATPGHAADHLAFALVGRDLLFSGDHVMGWSTTVVAPPDGSMADYMQSLNRLLARRERLYLPAHGGAISDAHPYMRGLRRHRLMRERAILEGIGAGDRTIAELVERVYRDLDPRLARGAALSTLAHLQDLVARELVRTDGEPELGSLYWPAGAPDG
jgi:glyoxylase-like metal-dependent hydrolase (beta-lactamase superfamily II)